MEHALTAHQVTSSEDSRFQDLIGIYIEAHPESERKSVDRLRAMLEREEYSFLVAMLGEIVVGFSVTICFKGSNACLLEYMAVAQHLRGQGIGQFLFRSLITTRGVAVRYLLLEVDANSPDIPEDPQSARRKLFYRRLGCKEVEGLRYIMPPVSRQVPPEMNILVFKADLPQTIDKAQLRAWLFSMYEEVYGLKTDDYRIDTMLGPLPEHPRLI